MSISLAWRARGKGNFRAWPSTSRRVVNLRPAECLELKACDSRLGLASRRTPRIATNLGLVGLDVESLQYTATNDGFSWPLPRFVHARIWRAPPATGSLPAPTGALTFVAEPPSAPVTLRHQINPTPHEESSVFPESTPPPGDLAARLVIRDVTLGCGGSIDVRRLDYYDNIEWLKIVDKDNAPFLKPSDRIVVTGNARCVAYRFLNGCTQEAVAQIESVRNLPARPPWYPSGLPDPSPVDSRFISLQCLL